MAISPMTCAFESLPPILQAYIERHRAAVEALRNHRYPEVGFVVMQPSGGGLGNRELVSVSGLAVALATDRVALVDWYGVTAEDVSDIHQMYENPYGLELSFPKVRALWEEWSGWKSQKMLVFDSTNVYDERWGAEELVCTELKEESETRVLRVVTEQYITSLVQHNPKLSKKLEPLGPALYQSLSKVFVVPIESVRARVEKFYTEHMEGNYVIGIQIRRARDSGHFFLWEDQHLFWDCALLMMKRALKANESLGKKVIFFLATDSELVRGEAAKTLSQHTTLLYVDMDTREPDTRGDEGWQNAMVDNYLLSKCDDLLVSGGSTFGYVAHGRSDIIPMVVSGIHHRCLRPVSAEPYNIAHLAIKKVSCFDQRTMLTPQTDMICSSVKSVHSCASHSSEKMAEVQEAKIKANFELGSALNSAKAYLDLRPKYSGRNTYSDSSITEKAIEGLLTEAAEHFFRQEFSKARQNYAKAALDAEHLMTDESKRARIWASAAYFGVAASYLMGSGSESSDDKQNQLLREGMKALYTGLHFNPNAVEANILMGNFMEMWGGTPRSHFGAQFYRRALWCLDNFLFEGSEEIEDNDSSEAGGEQYTMYEKHLQWAEDCTLMSTFLDEIENVNLEVLYLTVGVHLERALKKSGRDDESLDIRNLMEDTVSHEILKLRTKVGGVMNPEIIQMLAQAPR